MYLYLAEHLHHCRWDMLEACAQLKSLCWESEEAYEQAMKASTHAPKVSGSRRPASAMDAGGPTVAQMQAEWEKDKVRKTRRRG